MTPESTPKSDNTTGQPVNPVAEWWAENPMTYADDHGLVTYEGVQVPFGSIEFFDRVDHTFLDWNRPLHSPAPFGKIFDYQKYQGKKVLEIGCGMGTMASLWAKSGADVTAVDLNPVAGERAEIDDVGFGDSAAAGAEYHAHFQFVACLVDLVVDLWHVYLLVQASRMDLAMMVF